MCGHRRAQRRALPSCAAAAPSRAPRTSRQWRQEARRSDLVILRGAVLGGIIGAGGVLGDVAADAGLAIAQDDEDEQAEQHERPENGGDPPQTFQFHENPFVWPGTPRRFSGYRASMA